MGNYFNRQVDKSKLRKEILIESENLKNMIIESATIDEIRKKIYLIRTLVRQLEPTIVMDTKQKIDDTYIYNLKSRLELVSTNAE